MKKLTLALLLLFLSCLPAYSQGSLGDLSVTGATAGTGATSYTQVRCSTHQAFSSTASVAVTFPGCAAAGDLLLIFMAGQNFVTSFPSGWTNVGGNFGAAYSYWGGGVAAKILTSADITTGSATFTVASSGNTVTTSVEFVGTTAGFAVGDVAYLQSSLGTNSSVTGPATPLSPQPDDTVLIFGTHNGTGTDSIDTGTQLQTVAATNGVGVLNSAHYSSAGSTFSPTVSYGAYNPNGYFQILVMVHGQTSFTPRSIPGLKLWYSSSCLAVTAGVCNALPSDGASVTSWVNQATYSAATGSGTCTFHTAQINGYPAVTFDGLTCNFSVASPPAAAAQLTFAAVVANSSTAAKAELMGSGTSGPSYWTCASSKEQGMDSQAQYQVGTGTAACDTTWHLIDGSEVDTNAPTFRIDESADTTASPNAHSLNFAGPNILGRSGASSVEYLNGKAAELFYYTHALNSSEIISLENYLHTRYGLGSGFTPNVVQSSGVCGSNTSGNTKAFSANVTSGNVLVIAFKSETTGGTPTISDTLGTSYTLQVSKTVGTANEVWIWTGKASSSGANTVTITGGGSYDCTQVNEFSGLAGTVTNTGGLTTTSGTMTWTQTVANANSIVYAVVGAYHSATTFGAGTGWAFTSTTNGNDAIGGEWQQEPTAGSPTVTMTVSTTDNNVGASVVLQ